MDDAKARSAARNHQFAHFLNIGTADSESRRSELGNSGARHSNWLYTQRHPRTAIGWRADGTLVLVVVDGRQPRISVGMTINELAHLMLDLGCVEAINLDGGGSSTMVIRNKIVNNPSDSTGERPVSDALLIFPR
jgi:exopolysaccharide biosynthesis protein